MSLLKSQAKSKGILTKRNIFYSLSIVIGLILFAGTIKKVGFSGLLLLISQLSLAKFLLLILITILGSFLTVWRWRLILTTIHCRPSWLTTIRAWLADNAFSYLTPSASFGGEPLRLQILKEEDKKVSWPKAAATIFIDKGLDSTIALLIIIASLLFLLAHDILPVFWRLLFGGFTIILAVITFYIYLQTLRRRGYLSVFVKAFRLEKTRTWQKISKHLEEMESVTHSFFNWHHQNFWSVIFLTLIKASLNIGCVYFIILFLGNYVRPSAVIAAIGVGYLISFFPLPAALGSLEFSQSLVFSLLNMGAHKGLAYALIVRSLDVFLVAMGVAVVCHLSLRRLLTNNSARPDSGFK